MKVLRVLAGDERSESQLVELPGYQGPVVLRVLKPGLVSDVEGFVTRTRALRAISHPSLRVILGEGALADGRVFVVLQPMEVETLGGGTPVEKTVNACIDVSSALQSLHAHGFCVGTITPRDVYLKSPAVLDASLSALSNSTPNGDVSALTALIVQIAATHRSAADVNLYETLKGTITAHDLMMTLSNVRAKWHAATAPPPRPTAQTADVPPTPANLVGSVLGQWQLEKVVGEGAMGTVYLGKHQRIGRVAAVKVLKPEHATSADLVQRFIQEAQAVNAIRNEHIVEVYDFGEELQADGHNRVYCVMEMLEGKPLADELSTPFSVQRIARVGAQLSLALHAAHQVGVVHRDVKPENIFLHRKGNDSEFVKVLDFGVAKLLKQIGDIPRSGTQAGMIVGTPEYMAPEQALGEPIDFRGDIYAVGLVLYELLSGRQPFYADTFGRLVVEITTRPPPPLPAKTPSGDPIPPAVAQAVMRCLEKEPAKRFDSAEALAAVLEPFSHSGRTGEHPVFVPKSSAPRVSSATAVGALPESAAAQAIQPSMVPKVIAVLALLVVLGGAAFVVLKPSSSDTPAPVVEPAPAVVTPPVEVAAPTPPPVVAEPPKPTPTTVLLEVTSTPPGARVTRLDTKELLGTTPLKVDLAPVESLSVRVEYDGRAGVERQFSMLQNAAIEVALPEPKAPEPKADPKAPAKRRPAKKVSRDGVVDPFGE